MHNTLKENSVDKISGIFNDKTKETFLEMEYEVKDFLLLKQVLYGGA